LALDIRVMPSAISTSPYRSVYGPTWADGASARRYIQFTQMAEPEQVFWFLERMDLQREFLASLSRKG